MFSKKAFIKDLASISNRGAATVGEFEASKIVFREMNNLDIGPRKEVFKTPTRMPLIHFVHFFIIFLASISANIYPLVSALIGGLVIVSFWGEFTHKFFILRYLIPHKESVNVVGKIGNNDAKIKVVLSAHMDAAKAGLIFDSRLSHNAGRLKHQPLHKSLLIIMLILFTVFVIKAFGGGTWFLSVIFNLVAAIALIGSILMIQWEMAPYTEGANDDLSGLSVMLGVAEKIKASPPDDFQFIFVATGAEEAHCSGMKAYMKAHKDEYDKSRTYFINLECLGGGRLKYVTEEGFIIFQKHDHTLIQIADIVSKKYNIDFSPTYTVAHSESIVPLTLGFKSIGLIALNEYNVPTNYHQLNDTENNIDYSLLDHAEKTILKMIDVMDEFNKLYFL